MRRMNENNFRFSLINSPVLGNYLNRGRNLGQCLGIPELPTQQTVHPLTRRGTYRLSRTNHHQQLRHFTRGSLAPAIGFLSILSAGGAGEVVCFSETVDLRVKQYLSCSFPRTAPGFDNPETNVSALGCNKFQCIQRSPFLHPQGSKKCRFALAQP